MKKLLKTIGDCVVCQPFFEHPCRPIVAADINSKICIIGQAPGRKVQNSGIPWHDKSGENLRRWMGVSEEQFYDASIVAIVPMGFCYPGTGKSGDLPPRKECAPLWHDKILEQMPSVQLTLLIGKYAQDYYLNDKRKSLTDRVREFQSYGPKYFPLPHPSPRNNIWKKKNPWFEAEVIQALQMRIEAII